MTPPLSCSRCGATHEREGQRYCPDCHAAYQRKYRAENGYAVAARRRKADAIVAYIAERLTPADLHEPERTNLLEGMKAADQSIRDECARRAGQRSPSEATWALVVHGVEERIAWLARGQSMRRAS